MKTVNKMVERVVEKKVEVRIEKPVLSREENVATVTAAIKAAKHQREADALNGVMESDSDKAARVIKEEQDLKAAHNS